MSLGNCKLNNNEIPLQTIRMAKIPCTDNIKCWQGCGASFYYYSIKINEPIFLDKATQRHAAALDAYLRHTCLEELLTVWFRLYDILKKGNTIETVERSVAMRVQAGEGEMNVVGAQGILKVLKLFYMIL